MQKSYCYTPGVRVSIHVRVGVHNQNVRANVKVVKFQSLCIFSCILTLLLLLIKPLTTKAHDRRASGDCGTSGYFHTLCHCSVQSWTNIQNKCFFRHFQATQHTYSMNLGTNQVWDYVGDNFVHRLVQSKGDGKIVAVDDDSQRGDVEKIDSLSLEVRFKVKIILRYAPF